MPQYLQLSDALRDDSDALQLNDALLERLNYALIRSEF